MPILPVAFRRELQTVPEILPRIDWQHPFHNLRLGYQQPTDKETLYSNVKHFICGLP